MADSFRYQPSPVQIAAHRDEHHRKMLFWGRQVGKTLWSVNHAWLQAVMHQGRYFIVFRTYNQAKEVVWKQYIQMIPKELREKMNDTELTVELPYVTGDITMPWGEKVHIDHDTAKPKSLIQLLGSDQADSHRGRYAHGIIFDEYAYQNPDHWSTVYEPMFSTTNGWAVFMSTPQGYNHWYDMVNFAVDHPDEWYYSKATWRDNPHISAEAVQRARKEAEEKGRLSGFLQEYELEFRTVEDVVYPDFNREVHLFNPNTELPETGSLYLAIDFGWDHPTAVLFVWIDYQDNWWIFDEIYVRHTTIKELYPIIKEKIGHRRVVLAVCDSAQPENLAQLQHMRLPAVGVSKKHDGYPAGIALITQKLRPRQQLVGAPRPALRIGRNCKHLILNFEQYRYPKRGDAGVGTNWENPIKEHDDGPDALRYLMLHFKYGIQQKHETIKAKSFKGEYGIGI